MRISFFLLKRFALSLDVWFLSEHCLEMTEFSYLVRKGGWFPLLPPLPRKYLFSSVSLFLCVRLFSDKSYFVPDLISSVFQRLSPCQVNSFSLVVMSFQSLFPESSIKFVSPYVSSEKHRSGWPVAFDSPWRRNCEGEGAIFSRKSAPSFTLKFFLGASAARNSCPRGLPQKPWFILRFTP